MTALDPYRPFGPGTQPRMPYGPYMSSLTRTPQKAPIIIPQTLSEVTGPLPGAKPLWKNSHDLTKQHKGAPIGLRIILTGRVTDDFGRPVPNTYIEIWQCNAAGRYRHKADQWNAPLDPNFTGNGAVTTNENGMYRFVTIRPGPYPWGNHHNAWRPAHIHYSLFGPSFASRLVTQMYFPGDPLHAYDPIFNSVPDDVARGRLVAAFDWTMAEANHALAYRFDIVLRGRNQTPFEG